MSIKSSDAKPFVEQKGYWAYEYLRISEQLAAASARQWQATAFLVGGALAAAALVITLGHHDLSSFIQTLILGVGVSICLFLFKRWFLQRERWRDEILFAREQEIEEELDLLSGRYFIWLDEFKKRKIEIGDKLSEEERRKNEEKIKELLPQKVFENEKIRSAIERLHRSHPSPGVVGWSFVKWVVRVVILLWGILILINGMSVFCPWYIDQVLKVGQ